MLVGYTITNDGDHRHRHVLDETNPEILWRFVFQHRDAPRVLVTDAVDNIVIELLDGVIAWPALDAYQREALYQRFQSHPQSVVQ